MYRQPEWRPYGETGLTTAEWKALPPTTVRIADLRFTQPAVTIAGLLNAHAGGPVVGGDPLPHVVLWNGTYYLDDGHSRVLRALLRDEETVQARVWWKESP